MNVGKEQVLACPRIMSASLMHVRVLHEVDKQLTTSSVVIDPLSLPLHRSWGLGTRFLEQRAYISC